MSSEKEFNLAADEQSYIDSLGRQARNASLQLRQTKTEQKNNALFALVELIEKHRSDIKEHNNRDIEEAQINGLSEAMVDRLILNDKAIDGLQKSLQEIAMLKDPVGEIVDGWVLPNGLNLRKTRIPIGVVAIIYESRPNVTVDVGALGLKSSNAVILRGGKEAVHSNKFLTALFQKALSQVKLPADSIQLVDKTQRHLMHGLLRATDYIDLIVPRGGEGLIRFVSENSLIPVVKHDKGVCHIFIHKTADPQMASDIVMNAKTQRPGVCNAVETILFDKDFEHTGKILLELKDAGVTLHGDTKTIETLPEHKIEPLTEDGYHTEYLSLNVSVKLVDDTAAAIKHIQTYTSDHSEAIVAESYHDIEQFSKALDSAAIFVNCSTRFHDGGQFGLGAEVGISTGKLHARGPMGLSDLTTTKFVVTGTGQIRS